jgi:hypothetical protein
MEILDWGFCPELTFIKADATYLELEKENPTLAVCFAKFVQKAYHPQGKEDGKAWQVPHVPDGAVFWYELLKGVAATKPVTKALRKEIARVPDGADLDAALGRLLSTM